MAFYRYFKPCDALPDLKEYLSAPVSPSAKKDANKAVKKATVNRRQQSPTMLHYTATR